MEIMPLVAGTFLTAFLIGMFGWGIWGAVSDSRVIDRRETQREGKVNTLARKVQADLARRMQH